ncbi:hypothetical protein KJ781_02455 [Patescibacteria group bacterium]|nr:hypothetical protein [Patescibacteria group bacterium]MBU1448353.1 hypothetical protein [Patescibacteria group bacterium]MBU2613453.1 hypothetical protein [Patescibacteria group bacterium]
MKKQPPASKGYLALFATFLVVLGVAGVAHLGSQSKDGAGPQGLSFQVATSTVIAGPSLLIVDGQGSRIIVDGVERPTVWPDDTSLLGTPLSTLVGRKVLTGELAYLLPEFVLATSSAGFRSPDGRRSAHRAPSRQDGTGVVRVRYGNEERTYVLRLADGHAITDVNPIGWWDSETMAVTGFVTSSRLLFAVSLAGDVEHVAFLPDTIDRVRAERGMIRYLRIEPGEGLESAPRPPSSLHSVSRDGMDTVVAEEAERIILRYVESADGVPAYETDDGEGVAGNLGATDRLGRGAPIGFLVDGRVLLVRGAELIAIDLSTGVVARIAEAPGDDGAIFPLLSSVVDGTPQNR